MEIITDLAAGDFSAVTIGTNPSGFDGNRLKREQRDDFDRDRFKGSVCKEVFCTLETDQIRFTLDGVTIPSSTVGHLMDAGDNLTLRNIFDIENFKAARVTADASLKITYRY